MGEAHIDNTTVRKPRRKGFKNANFSVEDKEKGRGAVLTNEERELISSLIVSTCQEMFDSVSDGAPAGPEAAVEMRNAMAAAISLRGMHVRGALVVIARPSFFRSTYPDSAGSNPSDAQVVDWAGEAANRVLGRLCNRVAANDNEVRISSPTVVRALDLALQTPEDPTMVTRVLRVAGETVAVHFELRGSESPLIGPQGTPALAEGSAVLF